ncbi:MAG: DUF3987 domain-containing protein [Rhodocyclales bacterium]|nr:DUF3987 domain-containing protein [Rhodocyclales bacterium]
MNIIDIPQTVRDLLALRIDGGEPWGEPEELKFDLQPVAPFQATLLPEVLANFVMDAAHRMQCPPDFVAVANIAMFGSIIGTGCGVMPKARDNWMEFPNNYGGVVGHPGTLKSPALSAGMVPMAYLEDQAQRDYADAMAAYLLRKVEREFDIQRLKSDKGQAQLKLEPEQARQRITELMKAESEDEEPRLRRYRTNDATIEVIGEIARHNPRGLLVFRDELIGWLANCDKSGHEGDRSFYLEGWNGRNRFVVDRIGRGNVIVPHLCLSVFGGIQPAKLLDYIHGTVVGYDNDGLLQRLQLMVCPDELDGWKYVDEAPNGNAVDLVVEIARVLATTDFISLGAQRDGERGTPYFRFSMKAQKEFILWYTQLESYIRHQENPVLAEHFGKYRKLIPALALIFHLVDLASGKHFREKGISLEALHLAIGWGEYLSTHAIRIYSMALDPNQSAVTALAAKISSGKLVEGFSERDVYKSGWSSLTDADVVRAACAELEMAGWIRRIPVERGPGRPQSVRYTINPALAAK